MAIPGGGDRGGDWQRQHDYEKSVCKTKTNHLPVVTTATVFRTTTNYKTDIATKYKQEIKTYYKTESYPYYETKTYPYPATVTEYKPYTTTKESYVTVCKTKWYGDHYDYSDDGRGWKA